MNSYKHEQLLNEIFSNMSIYRDNFPSNLPIIEVLKSEVDVQQQAWTEDGIHVNSQFLDGLKCMAKIMKDSF